MWLKRFENLSLMIVIFNTYKDEKLNMDETGYSNRGKRLMICMSWLTLIQKECLCFIEKYS